MRKLVALVVVVALLGGLLLAVDAVLERMAERRLADEVAVRAEGAQGVTATIDSFPFVGRVLMGGDVKRVTVRAARASVGELMIADVAVVVDDVQLDRGEALRGRAKLLGIGGGTAQAVLTESEINRNLPRGFQVRLQDGGATVRAPAGVTAELVATGDGVVLRSGGRTITDLPVPASDLLPCRPRVSITAAGVILACSFHQIPPALWRGY